MSIITFDPAEIVKIKVEDLSAPVAVGIEMSKLYLAADKLVGGLVQDIFRDEDSKKLMLPPDLLPWFKEQRMLLTEIYKLTGEVEQKANLKKMELQAELFKQYIKDMPQEEKIATYQRLKNDNKKKQQNIKG